VPFQFDGYLVTGLNNPPHVVGLRLKELTALSICGASIGEATDTALRRNPVRELLEDHIGSEEIRDGFEGAHGSYRLQILMNASAECR
jgi:hypothetical protein